MRLSDRLKALAGVNGSTPSPIHVQMSRNDLPALTLERGFTRGAEIGVWKGEYSAKFCERNPALHRSMAELSGMARHEESGDGRARADG